MSVEWMVNGSGKRVKIRVVIFKRSEVDAWGDSARIRMFFQGLVEAGFDMEKDILHKLSRRNQEYRYWQECGDEVVVPAAAPGKRLRRLVTLERE